MGYGLGFDEPKQTATAWHEKQRYSFNASIDCQLDQESTIWMDARAGFIETLLSLDPSIEKGPQYLWADGNQYSFDVRPTASFAI